MDAAAFDALTEAAVDARAASGLTWLDEPWATWGRLLNDEGERRCPRYAPTQADVAGEHERMQGHCAIVLRLLQEAGPEGVTNWRFQEVLGAGAHHPGRIYDLRQGKFPALGAWEIKTHKLSMKDFKWTLIGPAKTLKEAA
jgi:hypothetical protein